LDVVAKQKMRDAIKYMNKTFHTTVILTTHDLDDIEELCDRIIMIDNGKIMYEGSLDEIKDIYGYMKTVKFEIAHDIELPDLTPLGLPKADLSASVDFRTLVIVFNKHRIAVPEITDFVLKRYKVIDMTVSEPAIETLVANIYEKGLNVT
ncbi:MAG: sugar ABC transporter ATP-binding protein, partial [bacterium]